MVEMKNFNLIFREDGSIVGEFSVKHPDSTTIPVCFDVKQDNVSFELSWLFDNRSERYKEFLLQEQKTYQKFILNYVEKIKKINEQSTFKGKIIKEGPVEFASGNKLHVYCKYDPYPFEIDFTFDLDRDSFTLYLILPIPFNSKGKLGVVEIRENDYHALTFSTIKKLWEPFRGKAKNKFKLLHFVR